MALVNCPECNQEISERANSCPKCGYSNEEINSNKGLSIFNWLKSRPSKRFLIMIAIFNILVGSNFFRLAYKNGFSSSVMIVTGIIGGIMVLAGIATFYMFFDYDNNA